MSTPTDLHLKIYQDQIKKSETQSQKMAEANKRFAEVFIPDFKRAYGDVEIRWLGQGQYWRREDPIHQLAPGTTSRVKITSTFGISQSDTSELGASLGVQGGVLNIANLSTQISARLGQTITLSLQIQEERELTLSNDRNDGYRLIAIWHPIQVFEVDYLGSSGPDLVWRVHKRVEFEQSSAQVTFADIRRT
jgi:hypothetical protein